MNLLEENSTSFKQRYTFRRDNWQADGANSKRALTYPVGWLLVQWFRFSFCQENSVQRAQLLLLVRKTALMPAYTAQPLNWDSTSLQERISTGSEGTCCVWKKTCLSCTNTFCLQQFFICTVCLSFLLSFPLGKLQLIIFGGKIRNSTFRDQKKGRGRRRQSATVFRLHGFVQGFQLLYWWLPVFHFHFFMHL